MLDACPPSSKRTRRHWLYKLLFTKHDSMSGTYLLPVHFPAKNKETLGLSPNTSSFLADNYQQPYVEACMHLCIHGCSSPYLKEMKEYSTRVHTCNLANIRVHSCIHASTCITRIHVMHVFAWMRVFNQPQHVQVESLYTTTRTVNKVLYISSMSFSSRK